VLESKKRCYIIYFNSILSNNVLYLFYQNKGNTMTPEKINPIEEKIRKIVKESAFSKQGYEITLFLEDFQRQMLDYSSVYDKENETLDSILEKCVPEFQRKNDKWTLDMQSKYVENILKGCSSKIQMFCLEKDYKRLSYNSCKIIDGLQRTTAIIEFFKDNVKVFDGLTYSEIKENFPNFLRRIGMKLTLEIFVFDTLKDAVKFYIDMNENITHSKEDIQKAKEYLHTLETSNDVFSLWTETEEKEYQKEQAAYKLSEEKRKALLEKKEAKKALKKQIK